MKELYNYLFPFSTADFMLRLQAKQDVTQVHFVSLQNEDLPLMRPFITLSNNKDPIHHTILLLYASKIWDHGMKSQYPSYILCLIEISFGVDTLDNFPSAFNIVSEKVSHRLHLTPGHGLWVLQRYILRLVGLSAVFFFHKRTCFLRVGSNCR